VSYDLNKRLQTSTKTSARWPAVSALQRAIADVKQLWSVIEWVTNILLSRAPPCFGRHVKPLVPAAFAVVIAHQPALGPRGVARSPYV
jgi:hypothetical protein